MNVQVPTSGDVQAAYWNGPLTRKEAQQVFDENAEVIQAQGQAIMAMNMTISFLMERFGFKPEEVAAWIKEKFANTPPVVPVANGENA